MLKGQCHDSATHSHQFAKGCESFESCVALSRQYALKIDIDAIEIWAVGGDQQIASALQARGKQRALNEDTLQKARSVDRAAFFNSTFDQEMFLGKTMAHKSEMQNRD
jgi:hypothetical protein